MQAEDIIFEEDILVFTNLVQTALALNHIGALLFEVVNIS